MEANKPKVEPDSGKMLIWNAVSKTPPSKTKKITGKTYQGVSPDPYYLIEKATELWGPMGEEWGFTLLDSKFVTDVFDENIVNFITIEIWYPGQNRTGKIQSSGGTTFSYKTSQNKIKVDDDAEKKSITDALTKGLSWLGFAGDIFSGLYDDNKYIQQIKREEEEAKQAEKSGQEGCWGFRCARSGETKARSGEQARSR
jgi:hypothetical protein